MSVETWRLFYDNMFDAPDKATFTGTHSGSAVTGYPWQRSVDGSRNTTFRVGFIPDASSISWDVTWASGNEPTPTGGQWGVALFNHNLRAAGATSIEVQASTGGGALVQVVDGYFSDMPGFGERDLDYVWLSDQTIFTLPIDHLLVRARFVTGAALSEVHVGQVMVFTGYIDTDGGPRAPIESELEALRPLRRTSAGDPSVTPALSQSQRINMRFPVQSHANADNYQKLIAAQRNAIPYALHPHAVPSGGVWQGPGASDQDVEGKGMAWMVSPMSQRLTYLTADRYSFHLAGLRQKGLGQWE